MTGLLEQLIGEDVHLAFRQSPDLWPVEADPGQIEQVIMNLAINARDAMPEGGKLTVETANVELNEDYVSTHLATEPGPYVMLAVSDTGCGMSRELLSHIFEPFFTTKDPGKGTGLGLSTVYGILKQSGGSIWVYSEPGKGTTFKVYLPRADKPVDWSPRSRATPDGASRDGDETILLVEDEPAVLRLAARVLASRGYVVFTAGSPEEAITLFREHPGRVHLLLTDVILPGMSGHALAEVLTGEQSQAPRVLYMSGYTRNAIVHEGRLDADIEFLEKPFTPEALARRVREVLDMPVAAPPTFPA
ncbi:MAG: ATP-binding protein [Thermoleophilia bacterium]|nr:ATP-binding protein [Thermoleophilia bacterium]